MESTFELFSIGIGPSSSHTVGPMKAGFDFVSKINNANILKKTTKITIDLYGSLALTGKGHKTDYAIILGIMGFLPHNVNIDESNKLYEKCLNRKKLSIFNKKNINFNYHTDLNFHYDKFLTEHSNGMKISAYNENALLFQKKYFSIGGGFILDDQEIKKDIIPTKIINNKLYNFSTAKELNELCLKNNLSIDELIYENEKSIFGNKEEVNKKLNAIWQTMEKSIERGINSKEDILPGCLKVKRRAPKLYKKLLETNTPKTDLNIINTYAIAVNEENASGGKVVTAPTNGAAGIIPAVLKYFLETKNITNKEEKQSFIAKYLFTCSAIGILYKSGASISAAEVGCQGEIGVACSMAAAGYCALLGGSIKDIESAAEIAMEHNLGLTCDPIGGLVQIPCIERNSMGAVQAINAAKLAYLDSGEKKFVGLDYAIKAMYETGLDMNIKYKETSLGGLAINVPIC